MRNSILIQFAVEYTGEENQDPPEKAMDVIKTLGYVFDAALVAAANSDEAIHHLNPSCTEFELVPGSLITNIE
jgi:hypothetical protein